MTLKDLSYEDFVKFITSATTTLDRVKKAGMVRVVREGARTYDHLPDTGNDRGKEKTR